MIIRHGSPELVELAEAKLWGEPIALEDVRSAAQPMFDAKSGARIDTVVLACTHFPLLKTELEAAFPNVAYVDGGEGIARRIQSLTDGQPWPLFKSDGVMVFTYAASRPRESQLLPLGFGQILIL